MSDLKPCMCCGKSNRVTIYSTFCYANEKIRNIRFGVKCERCGIELGTYSKKETAIKRWNTRPAEDALNKELTEQAANYENIICEYKRDVKQAVEQIDALTAEVERIKNDLEIQKNLTRMACFESNRAYDEVEKWKKMFYDLIDKQSNVATDPKVIIVGTDTNVPANAPDTNVGTMEGVNVQQN